MSHPEAPIVYELANTLARRFGDPPEVSLVLGSGLGGVAEALGDAQRASYVEVGLPESSVPGHNGEIVIGTMAGKRIACLSGRVHLYEGHGAAVSVRPLRALKAWGTQSMILTSSVGGIRSDLGPGSLVLVTDHINLQGVNPLIGPAYGTRFPDLTKAYDPVLRERLLESAAALELDLYQGVYAAMPGPAYETPAEIRMLGLLGADIVGMSVVAEVLAAAALGLPIAAVAVVANAAAGLSSGPLHHEEVTEAANHASERLTQILIEALR